MRKLIICIFMVLGGYLFSFAQHPSLLFTQEEVNEMRAGKGTVPAFDKSLSEVLAAADAAVNSPVSVPVPVDGGGGVVHEQHKSNYYAMFHCGTAFSGRRRRQMDTLTLSVKSPPAASRCIGGKVYHLLTV